MTGVVGALCDKFDVLKGLIGASGNFEIKDNFDVKTKEFKAAADFIAENIAGLKETNEEAFNEMTAGMADAGVKFGNNLEANQAAISAFMTTNTENAVDVLQRTTGSALTTINETTQAAGTLMETLGDVIKHFDYTVSFTPVPKGSFDILGMAKAMFLDGDWSNVELPQLDLKISGSAGRTIANFASTLKKAGTYFAGMSGNNTGRSGANNLGTTDFDATTLNPDDIDLGDDKSSKKSGKTKDAEKLKDLKDIEDRYHEITREIKRQDDLLDDIDNDIDRAYGGNKL
ncbi:MAG: hypothetical protein NC548_25695 [Lachnospiraceae bacterium]|nr:hypothetical protein [Lachnospiraceae bacterium]